MNMLKKLAIVHAVLCVGSVASAKDNAELITFVLTQNAEAANRILSLSYKSEYECDMDLGDAPAPVGSTTVGRGNRKGPMGLPRSPSGGRTHAEGREEVIQKGNLRWTSKQEHKNWKTTGSEQDFHARTVINNDYAAMWKVGQPYAYQFDHESIPSISPDAATRLMLASSRDSMLYAMGPRDRSHLLYYMETRDTKHWEIEEKALAGSTSLFYVKEYSGTALESNHLESVLVIDPKKDFLITRSTFYRPDGTISAETNVTLEKSEDANIWLPKAIDEKQYRPASGTRSNGNDRVKWLRIHITDVLVNPAIDDTQFTLEALQIPDGVKLVRRFSDGVESILVKRGGGFEMKVVAEMVDQIAAMTIRGAENEVDPNVENMDKGTRRQESSTEGGGDQANRAAAVKPALGYEKEIGWIVYCIIAVVVVSAAAVPCVILRRRERR